ncbi:hypothetical protein [Succinimonas sp.]|uniref:hypothetical protein n=1 Tax=Succinimonas sp. TaxID=1936151 RepID=UPI00386B75DD
MAEAARDGIIKSRSRAFCLSFLAGLFLSGAAEAGWRTDVAHSTVIDGNPVIVEAAYLDKEFLDSFEMSVGCRNSWPLPAFMLRLPALTTDIMNPDAPAVITFAFRLKDLEKDPKTGKYRGGYQMRGVVKHGDYVFVPTGYNGPSEVMLTLLAEMDTTDRKHLLIRFNQGSREWTYLLPLQGYRQAYQAALKSCRDVRPRDGGDEIPTFSANAVSSSASSADDSAGNDAAGAGASESAQGSGDEVSDAPDSSAEEFSSAEAPDPEDAPASAPENTGEPVTGVVLAGAETPDEAEKALLEEAAKGGSGGEKSSEGDKKPAKKRLMNASAGN